MDRGAQFYRDFGVGRSHGTIPIQLAGNLKHGGLYETAFGLPLGQLINEIGGGTISGRPVKAVQVGGPLGAYFPPSMFHLPFDYESFAAAGGLIGHAGITVFDDSVDMAKMARFAMEFCAVESCGKCTPCRIGSTRGVEVIDKIRQGTEERPRQVILLRELCDTMLHGSLCAMGGMTPYPVLSALNHFPQDFGQETYMIETIISRDFGTPPSLATDFVTLTIDGQRVTVAAGTSVMRAAAESGTNIPKLCATDSLEPFGSCRLCLVE
eukprot:gene37024-41919_t